MSGILLIFLTLFFSDRIITETNARKAFWSTENLYNVEVGLQFHFVDKWLKCFSSSSQGAATDADLP